MKKLQANIFQQVDSDNIKVLQSQEWRGHKTGFT